MRSSCESKFSRRRFLRNSSFRMILLSHWLSCAPLSSGTPSRTETFTNKLQRIIDEHSRFFNASISLAIHNDTLEAAVASGQDNYADPSSRLTVNKSIPMGSTTKMYSAVGVLRLVENGTISLDQKVAPLVDRYLGVKLP